MRATLLEVTSLRLGLRRQQLLTCPHLACTHSMHSVKAVIGVRSKSNWLCHAGHVAFLKVSEPFLPNRTEIVSFSPLHQPQALPCNPRHSPVLLQPTPDTRNKMTVGTPQATAPLLLILPVLTCLASCVRAWGLSCSLPPPPRSHPLRRCLFV